MYRACASTETKEHTVASTCALCARGKLWRIVIDRFCILSTLVTFFTIDMAFARPDSMQPWNCFSIVAQLVLDPAIAETNLPWCKANCSNYAFERFHYGASQIFMKKYLDPKTRTCHCHWWLKVCPIKFHCSCVIWFIMPSARVREFHCPSRP